MVQSLENGFFSGKRPLQNRSMRGTQPYVNLASYLIAFYRSLSQSQSLSQELSSARLRKTSISSQGSSSAGSYSPSVSFSKPNLSLSLPNGINGNGASSPEKSVTSLEKEIMRLQDVLKDREMEIAALEMSLKGKSSPKANGGPPLSAVDSFVSAQEEFSDDSSQATPIDGAMDPSITLSPKTMDQFNAIRNNMDVVDIGAPDPDDSLRRLNELMRLVVFGSYPAGPADNPRIIVPWLRKNPVIVKSSMISTSNFLLSASSTTS